MSKTGTRLMATALAVAAAFSIGVAHAADKVDVEAAKKEGKVVWYTSTPIKISQQVADLFEKETGVHVELFRSGGSAILRRFMQENQAGLHAADVMTTSDPADAAKLAKNGMFVNFKPENFDKIPDFAKDPNGAYIAQTLNMMVIFLRSDKVAEADYPKTWTDVLDPKYKGKLVMPDPSFTSVQLMVVSTLSHKLGWAYYEKIKANDIMIVQGNQQVTDAIKRSERVIAVGALNSYASDARNQGHPIVTIYPADGTFIIPQLSAIIKDGPHPNAAKLFAQFLISDSGQKLFPTNGGYAARSDIDPPKGNPRLADVKPMPIDYAQIEKDAAAVKKKFNEVFQ